MKTLFNRPLWVNIQALAMMLTAFTCPLMMAVLPRGTEIFIVLYPLYALIGSLIAWKVYPDRTDIYWTLVILIWSSFALMWLPLLEFV